MNANQRQGWIQWYFKCLANIIHKGRDCIDQKTLVPASRVASNLVSVSACPQCCQVWTCNHPTQICLSSPPLSTKLFISSPHALNVNNVCLVPESRIRDITAQDVPSVFNASFSSPLWSLTDMSKQKKPAWASSHGSWAVIKVHTHNNKAVNSDPAVLYSLNNSSPAVKVAPLLYKDGRPQEEGGKGHVIFCHIEQSRSLYNNDQNTVQNLVWCPIMFSICLWFSHELFPPHPLLSVNIRW